MKKSKYLVIIGAVCTASLMSCQDNSELEQRVDSLEEKVDKLSAPKIINNPATINNPNSEVIVDGPVAGIQFAEQEHNFGTITAGDQVEHVFSFTNTGENPLLISNAKGSCGCTVPEYPKEPIAPGETPQMLVKFNSSGKVGNQRKSVTVTANTVPATTQVFIVSNVLKNEGTLEATPVVTPIPGQ